MNFQTIVAARYRKMLKRWLLIIASILALVVGDRQTSGFRSLAPNVHQEITKAAIGPEFQDKATLQAIYREIRETDFKTVKYNDNALHFDNEAFSQSTERLAQNLNDAMTLLSECKKGEAIEKIGEALHALQDFYSHSNWVENHLSSPVVAPGDIPICPLLLNLGSDGVFSAGSLAADPGFADPSWNPKSNTCFPAPGLPANVVTGGYHPAELRATGKCTHNEINKDWRHNNTDFPSPRGAYEWNDLPLHLFAKDVALRHTMKIWGNDNPLTSQGIKQALTLRFGPVQGVEYYNVLVKKRINTAFVIDVTSSMSGALGLVKAKVHAWVPLLQNATDRPHLTLVTFTDSVAFQGTTCSPSVFLDWVDALSTGGGGDCPEASLTAALVAADLVGTRGTVVLATDAPPGEDEATFEQIKAVLTEKDITCHTIWKDACFVSPSDQGAGSGEVAATLTAEEVYPELAEISGGLSLPFDEMDKALDLVLESILESLAETPTGPLVESEIHILIGGPGQAPGQPQLFNVSIDAGLASVDFVVASTSGANVLLEVMRPNGALVQPIDPDATFITGAALQVIGVSAPIAGIWVVRITGEGPYDFYVRGIGDTSIFDVTFLRIEEVEGESPLISIIDGPLQLWETVGVEIDMIGPVPALSFDLIRPDGSVIEPLEVSPDALGLGTYSGLYTPETVIDRFYVRARDAAGGPFQRILRRGFSTYADLAVLDAAPPATTSPGCQVIHRFQIQNLGDPDSFTVTAVSQNSFPLSLSTALLNLLQGESAWVDITLSVPTDATVSEDSMTLDVKSNSDATRIVATVLTHIDPVYGCNCNGVPDECELPVMVWNADPLSPDRASRTLTMSLEEAGTGGAESAALQIKMVDLQHPSPRNRPQYPTPNFTAFDTTMNGVCSGATTRLNFNGHHCDTSTDCLGPNNAITTDDGTCGSLLACTAAGEANGCVRWVGPVATFREKQDVLSLGTYQAARLQCTPYYRDWTAVGPFSVFGPEVLPSSYYEGVIFGSSCKGMESTCTNVSQPVTMYTRRWGDTVSTWNPPGSTDQPDGTDVFAVLNKFRGLVGSPTNATALLQPNAIDPNADVSGSDIVATVDAFKGLAYPFSGPCPCPSTVICGALACPPGNCGSGVCVKTCVGGTNAGLPCGDNTHNHCPGGTCPDSGFYRDRCGRCTP